jgi:hypothetical protein
MVILHLPGSMLCTSQSRHAASMLFTLSTKGQAGVTRRLDFYIWNLLGPSESGNRVKRLNCIKCADLPLGNITF